MRFIVVIIVSDVSNGSNFGQTEINFQINGNELYILYIVKPAIIVENCGKTELVTSTVKHAIDVSISCDHFYQGFQILNPQST